MSVLGNVGTITSRSYHKNSTGNRREENYDHDIVHRLEINHSQCFVKRQQMESVIFRRLAFSGFRNCKSEFSPWVPTSTLCVNMDNSMSHNRSKVTSKFERCHISRLSQTHYLPDIIPCNCWLFDMLKAILTDYWAIEMNQGWVETQKRHNRVTDMIWPAA
jgi:hypothetical protein